MRGPPTPCISWFDHSNGHVITGGCKSQMMQCPSKRHEYMAFRGDAPSHGASCFGQTCMDPVPLSAATRGIPSGAGHRCRPGQTRIPPRIYAPFLPDPCSSSHQQLEASRNPHLPCIRRQIRDHSQTDHLQTEHSQTDQKSSSQYPGGTV